MNAPIRLAVIGIGKIARDQHLPAIAADPDYALTAAVSRNAQVGGVAGFRDIDALVASRLELDAVAICTPPLGRHLIAAKALAAGWHVMLEKPPGATLSEVHGLIARAGTRTLFASWHSREAAGVTAAKTWLADKRIAAVRIAWREDIRVWHPGQEWILAAGGLGVFDPGINALSIATRILPGRLRLEAARLDFPAGRSAPIAASLQMVHDESASVTADFDFRQLGPPRWDIAVDTDAGTLALGDGGKTLSLDGTVHSLDDAGEYAGLYHRFAALIAAGASDCDLRPLELVADAFLLGERIESAAFEF